MCESCIGRTYTDINIIWCKNGSLISDQCGSAREIPDKVMYSAEPVMADAVSPLSPDTPGPGGPEKAKRSLCQRVMSIRQRYTLKISRDSFTDENRDPDIELVRKRIRQVAQ